MAWLVSMKYEAKFWKGPGHATGVGPSEGLFLITEHPAQYVADCKRRLTELYGAKERPDRDRADDVLAIYSAIEIPDGLLTADEIDRLS